MRDYNHFQWRHLDLWFSESVKHKRTSYFVFIWSHGVKSPSKIIKKREKSQPWHRCHIWACAFVRPHAQNMAKEPGTAWNLATKHTSKGWNGRSPHAKTAIKLKNTSSSFKNNQQILRISFAWVRAHFWKYLLNFTPIWLPVLHGRYKIEKWGQSLRFLYHYAREETNNRLTTPSWPSAVQHFRPCSWKNTPANSRKSSRKSRSETVYRALQINLVQWPHYRVRCGLTRS